MSAKKVSEKKSSAKKSSGKKKATAEVGASIDLIVEVPEGGQVLKTFVLTPALPVGGVASSWALQEEGSTDTISSITVLFSPDSTQFEAEFERCVFLVKLNQATTGGTWRFALGGVATDLADADPATDVGVEIIDNGLTMLVYIHAPNPIEEDINFGYVASFTDSGSGVVSIYESQDPSVVIRRS